MKAIVHIGTFKTGSTSIQNSLFSNRELLLERGVIYPDIGSGFQHWGLFTAFMDEHPSNFHLLQGEGWGKEKSEKWSVERLQLIRQHTNANSPYMIISAEDFHRINLKLKDFKSFLDDLFEEYFILLYGRCSESYYCSWISESIGQGVKTFTPPLDYKDNLTNVVNRWKSVFNDRFIARPFSSESLVNGDVVDDFLKVIYKVLGANLKPAFIKVHENVSPSGTAIALLHLFNKQNNRFLENKLNTFWLNGRELLRYCPASEESPKLSLSKDVREAIAINNLPEWKQFIEICRESCQKYGLVINEDSIAYEEDVATLKNQIKEFDFEQWIESYLTPKGLNYVMTYIVDRITDVGQASSLLVEAQQKLSYCSSQLQEKEALLEKALDQLQQKTKQLDKHTDLQQAITKYHRQLDLKPNSFLLHQKLGQTLATKKNLLNEAVAEFNKAIELKPNSALSYGYLGEIMVKQELLDQAISYFKQAIAIQPGFYRFYNGLGLAWLKKAKWDEAIKCFEKAIKLKPDFAWVYCNMALVFFKKGELERASCYYSKAVKLHPLLLNPSFSNQDESYVSQVGLAQRDLIQSLKSIINAKLTEFSQSNAEEVCTFNIDELKTSDREGITQAKFTIQVANLTEFGDSELLWGFNVEEVEQLKTNNATELFLKGWVLGKESKVEAIEITHNHIVVKKVCLNYPRSDVANVYNYVDNAEMCGFEAVVNISELGNRGELLIQAVCSNKNCIPLKKIQFQVVTENP